MMKVCEYCDSLVNDTDLKCPNCGANEFLIRCPNCGRMYKDEEVFCPECGVRTGQKPYLCPNCRTSYYTDVCPHCGAAPGQTADAQSRKGGPTVLLWVLGWIFIYPVPATILLARSKKMPAWAKVLTISAVWLSYVFLILIAESDETETAMALLKPVF